MSRVAAPRIVLVMLLLAILACSPIPSLPNPQSIAGTAEVSVVNTAAAAVGGSGLLGTPPAFTPVPTTAWDTSTYLPARVDKGALTLNSATTPGSDGAFYGPIMSLQVTNPGSQDVLMTISCGLIFQPDNTDEQRLMVLQPLSATVGAGQSTTLTPYVICIDDGKHAPATDATYTIGTMAGGDLLKLAACVCGQPLTFKAELGREFGLQFAIWHTSDPLFPGNLSDSPLGPAIQPFLSIGLATTNGWLSSCGLPPIN